ncbi:MAG: glycine zipper 2TM domain-containing protein, partial [Burkholderiales bacterium]
MNKLLKTTLAAAALVLGSQAMAQITFYEGEGFRGRAYSTTGQVDNLDRTGFNDRTSSVVIDRGRWEVCEDSRFRGRCVVLRRGNYDNLREFGMENRISSVRPVSRERRYENEVPEPVAVAPIYEYRQRPNERIYEVPVTSARAVVGPPNQRCWIERQQVTGSNNNSNIGGAVVGGLIGGILGHQVGGGSGKDIATAGGAIAGAAIGAN